MMRSAMVCIVAAVSLAGCSTPERRGPPAPIVSAPTPSEAPALNPAAEAPDEAPETVSVYPYQEPSTVAEGPAPEAPRTPTIPTGGEVPNLPSEGAGSPSGGGDAEVAYAPDQAEAPELTPAATGLLQQAEQQRQSRDYPGAAASLERALRISPQSAYLWNRLARVRLEQGLSSQAMNLAARSNALAGGDQATLKQDNWAVIAAARRRTGDAAGAAEAERRARGG